MSICASFLFTYNIFLGLSDYFTTPSFIVLCNSLHFFKWKAKLLNIFQKWVWQWSLYIRRVLWGGGGGIHPLPSKRKVSLKKPFASKMSNKGLNWPKMPCLKTHIPCSALVLDAPLWIYNLDQSSPQAYSREDSKTDTF